MAYSLSTWFTLGLTLIGLNASAAISLDELISNSPFAPHAGAATQASTSEATTLEFRGVMTSSEGTVFGLHDITRNQSKWVRENEKGTEFNIVSYDANNQVVNVDYQGRRFSLALSTSKIGLAAASPVSPLPSTPVATSVNAGSTSDQSRLETIAAEVRRRRVLRMAAPGATPPIPPP